MASKMTLDLQTMSSYFMGNNFCPAYKTKLGGMFVGDSIELLKELDDNSVNLVITSPLCFAKEKGIWKP